MPAIEQPTRPPVASPPLSGSSEPANGGGRNVGGLIRRLALAVILIAAVVLGYFKFQANKQQADATTAKTLASTHRATPVTTMPVVAKTMPIYLTALGTVTAYNTVTVKSRVDGQLLSVNVREGQQVSQGQLLAVIDPAPYQATLAQAKGQLAKDQAAADYSNAEASRYTALYDAGVVSKESQQTQISSAGQSVGTLAADRAAIQAAQVNVNYTRITSPISGIVGLRQVDAGNIVHATDSNGLLVVTQLQPISVIFTLPEDQLPEVLKLVRAGHKLVAEAYDRSESTKLATGTLLTVDNEIDPTTGTVKAKAVFDNRDGALFPNQFVNIRLILEERQNAIVVPAAALQSGTNGPFVYLLKAGVSPKKPDDEQEPGGDNPGVKKQMAAAEAEAGDSKAPKFYVEVRNVVVDLIEGTQVILKSGLAAGDLVVTDGQEKLKPYSKVSPKPGKTGSGGAAAAGAPGRGEAHPAASPDATPASPIAPPATEAAHAHAGGSHQ
jgi:multidrug efflux system membrane fusion protein